MNRIQILDSLLLESQLQSLLNDQLSAFQHRSLPRNLRRFYTKHSSTLKLIIECLLLKLLVINQNGTYSDLLTGQRLTSQSTRLLFVIGKLLQQTISIPILNKFFKIATFINSLLFLHNGIYPTILHRLTHTSYISVATSLTSNPDSISYEFQDRQLIWSTLAEAANSLQLPKWWKFIKNENEKIDHHRNIVKQGICPIDGNTVCNPHIVDCCDKIYCYICAINIIGKNCLNCGKLVQNIKVFM